MLGRHPPTRLGLLMRVTRATHSTLFLVFHPNDLNTSSPLVERAPETLKSRPAAPIAAAAARRPRRPCRPISTFSPARPPPSPLLTPRPRPSPVLFLPLRTTLPTSRGRSRSSTTKYEGAEVLQNPTACRVSACVSAYDIPAVHFCV